MTMVYFELVKLIIDGPGLENMITNVTIVAIEFWNQLSRIKACYSYQSYDPSCTTFQRSKKNYLQLFILKQKVRQRS